jgi:hypothetical protein
MGVPELEATRYEGRIKGGHILISVQTKSFDQAIRAEAIFEVAHADDICSAAQPSVVRGTESLPTFDSPIV